MQVRQATAARTLQVAHPRACTAAGWVAPLPSLLRLEFNAHAHALYVVIRRVAGGWYDGCRRHCWRR